ncbi:hypothetical protein JW921_06300 [Candidatus Fermentibacterales bacterium]|nr:hypothetical protein [Candidatus Fermentibacterales bacterium]
MEAAVPLAGMRAVPVSCLLSLCAGALLPGELQPAAQGPEWTLGTSLSHVTSLRDAGCTDQGLWASTAGGVFHYDPASGQFDETLSYPDPLPERFCNDVLLDSQGRLWVATKREGVAMRQDGFWIELTSFEGLPGTGAVFALHEAGGSVWAGTDGGLGKWQDGSFVPLEESTTGGAFLADEVTGIEDLDGFLWLATDRGVYALDLSGSPFNPDSWADYGGATQDLGLRGLESMDGVLYGFGTTGVYRADSGDWWVPIWDAADVSDLLGITSQGLVAASQGVYRYEPGSASWVEVGSGYPQGMTGVYFCTGLAEIEGELWCSVGSDGIEATDWGTGIARLEEDEWQLVEIPGQPASSCYQMMLDQNGVLYLGSHLRGLLGLFTEGWRYWGFDEGMPNMLRTYSCASDGQGGMWTASYHYGLTWVGGASTWESGDDSLVVFLTDSLSWPPGLTQVICPLYNMQVNMLARQGDVLWIPQEAYWATPDEPSGLVGLRGCPPDPQGLEWVLRDPSTAGGMAFKDVLAVMPVGSDTLWIAYAEEHGCQMLDHQGTPMDADDDAWMPDGRSFTTEHGLPSGQVYCFAVSPDGQVFAGTGAGLCSFDGDGFSSVNGIYGSIRTLDFDGAGRLWCSGSAGVFVLDEGSVTLYDSSNSPFIPGNRAEPEFSFFDQSSGNLYISSSSGLWIVHAGTGGGEPGEAWFYPQPFLPAEHGLLRVSGLPEGIPLSVDFFTLSGEHTGSLRSESGPAEWTWNGSFDGGAAASGVYVGVIRQGSTVVVGKIALVR